MEHKLYLEKFSDTRRMKRDGSKLPERKTKIHDQAQLLNEVNGEYFVDGFGMCGQDEDESVLEYNYPPATQPGLWCQWIPNEDGTAINWNGAEKFYNYTDWIDYIANRLLAPLGYVLNGEVEWQGEERDDMGLIVVKDNVVTTKAGFVDYK